MARITKKLTSMVVFLLLILPAYLIIMIAMQHKDRMYIERVTERTHQSSGDLYIDGRIDAYLDEYISDAKIHGFNIDQLYKNLDEIILTKTDWKGNHGVCHFYFCEYDHLHGRIELSEALYYKDTFGFKTVMYHELGHWFGRKHTFCDDKLIMHWQYDSDRSDSLQACWENSKEIFFNFPKYKEKLGLCGCFEAD